MYDRNKRFHQISTHNVGPATYVLPDSTKTTNNFLKFLHCSRFKEQQKREVQSIYFPKYRKQRIKGGSSLRYTAPQRIDEHKDIYPLVCDPDHIWRPIKKKLNVYSKVFKKKPPRYECQNISSSTFIALGVTENVKARLANLNQQLFDVDHCITTLKYKGNEWSKRKEKRFRYFNEETPGPGSYNVDVPKRTYESKQLQSEMSYDTCLDKSTGEDRNAVPGPGKYFVNYDILFEKISHNKMKSLSFISKSERKCLSVKSDSPGPGNYTLMKPSKKSFTKTRNVAFMTSIVHSKNHESNAPGPGQYCDDFESISYKLFSKLKLKYEKLAVFAPFDSLVGSSHKSSEFSTPGPADYNIDDKPKRQIFNGGKRASNTFEKALKTTDSQENTFPPRYDVLKVYDHIYKPTSHNKAKDLSFLSTSTRNVFFGAKASPSPAAYYPIDIKPSLKGALRYCPSSEQKKTKIFPTPSPNTYKIHPKYSSSVYRGTFNVTLGKFHQPNKFQNEDSLLLLS